VSGPDGEPVDEPVDQAVDEQVEAPARAGRERRGMVVALGVTALGAVLVLGTSRQSRWASDATTFSGGGVPGAGALALVALAGIGLLLLVRGVARSVIGVLLLLCGVAVVLVDARSGRGGFLTYAPVSGDILDAHRSVWFWLTAAGGVVIALGGALTAVRGHRWPTTRRSYQPTPRRAATPADTWSALDRGEDPTA
jgi:hypothetical protein